MDQLHAVGHAGATHVHVEPAHALEVGRDRSDLRRVAAHDEEDLARDRLRLGAEHRRIHVGHAPRRERLGHRERRLRAHRRAVAGDEARLRLRRDPGGPEVDVAHDRVVRQAGEEDRAPRRDGRRRVGHGDAGDRRRRRGRDGVRVVDDQRHARLGEVRRHGHPHRPHSDEADRVHRLLACGECSAFAGRYTKGQG